MAEFLVFAVKHVESRLVGQQMRFLALTTYLAEAALSQSNLEGVYESQEDLGSGRRHQAEMRLLGPFPQIDLLGPKNSLILTTILHRRSIAFQF